jgi:hypothetical protein
MKSRNLKLMTVLAATATLTAGSASLGEDAPFGLSGDAVPLTEAMVDAARGFDKIDVNNDGLIDEDEFAGQKLVYAQLARFSRSLTIDGQTPIRVDVPATVPDSIGVSERAALDAVARRDFRVRNLTGPGLTEADWQQARLEPFRRADKDGDGILRGRELAGYAALIAGQISAPSAAS